jgi:hypothetical protein
MIDRFWLIPALAASLRWSSKISRCRITDEEPLNPERLFLLSEMKIKARSSNLNGAF